MKRRNRRERAALAPSFPIEPQTTKPLPSIPWGPLCRVSETLDMLADLRCRIVAADQGSPEWAQHDKTADILLATFAAHLDLAVVAMRAVRLDSAQKEEVAAALQELAECWAALGCPGDGGAEEASHHADALLAAGVRLRAAADAVPACHLLEALDYAEPVPWRPVVPPGQTNGDQRPLSPLGVKTVAPWEGDDYDELEPLIRRLLIQMCRLERADLTGLCPAVWGKDYADVSESALATAMSKANNFLRKRQSPRLLAKDHGEPFLHWE